MKKRGFLNLCAVAALATVTAGSLYSCKDYDDEMYAELNGQIVDQNSTLEKLIKQNEQGLKDLKSELKTTKEDLEKKLADLKDDVAADYATKAELAAQVAILNTAINNLDKALNKKVDDLSDTVDGAIDRIVVLETAKEEAFALIGKLDERVTKLENKTEGLGKDVEELKKLVSAFETAEDVKTLVKDVADTKAQTEANKALAEANQKLAQEGVDQANANKEAIEKLEKRVAANEAELAKVDGKLAGLKEELMKEVNKVAGDLNVLDTKVSTLQNDFKEAQANLQKQINGLKTDLSSLQADVAGVKKELAALGLKIDALQDKVDNMVTSVYVNGAYSPVVGYFSLPTGLKSNILAAYYGSVETNDPMGLDFPSTELTDIVGAAKDNSALKFHSGNSILAKGFNAGKVYMTLNPSSVNMEGKTFALVNSVGDTASLALGAAKLSEDKLAFGYTRAGVNKNFYEVPARLDSANVANAKLRVEMSELKEAVGMVKDAVVNKSGLDVTKLASTLFMCINDIADANAVKVSWNTKDGVQHDVMSDFGIAAVAVKPLSYEFMKDYEITNFWGIDYAYKAVDKIVAEAKDYNKQLTAQFPHFEVTLPVIKQIEVTPFEELDKKYYTIHIEQEVTVDLDFTTSVDLGIVKPDPANNKVVIDPYDQIIYEDGWDASMPGAEKHIVAEIHIPGQTINYPDYIVGDKNIRIQATGVKIPLNFDVDAKDMVEGLYGEITAPMDQVNEMLKELDNFLKNDLQNMIDEINGMGGKFEGNLNDLIDKVDSKLTGLIGKVNNALCKIVNNVNEALQPVMFAQANDFLMVSRAENAPSLFGDKFVLVPSSYTGEYLAPAAQKYVAVTNVIKGDSNAANNAECKAVLENTNKNNADLNKVLDGGNHAVAVENLAKGYTYEFTYSAVDFYGKVRNTKCYVAVK